MNFWRLKLKLWGVRGSTPTPERENLGFGGNTSCVEIRLPNDELFIFDAGSGIRDLGRDLAAAPGPKQPIKLFFTHFHWDHIQGLPFFGPLYDPSRQISFYSSRYASAVRPTLAGQMTDPYFPVKFDMVSAKRDFIDLDGEAVAFGDVKIQPFPLNHPQGAGGYRIEYKGAVIVYATDREHGHERLDSVVRDFAQNADILIHDSQYTPEEYTKFKGWGHSTWEEAVDVARDCNVKQVILFHHDPSHNDAVMSHIVERAREEFPNLTAACEGWSTTL